MQPQFKEAKFVLGVLFITAGAAKALTGADIKQGLFWHSQGFWGHVSEEDQKANDQALVDGTGLLSEYAAENGTRFWVITEADRRATTVLLPDEY